MQSLNISSNMHLLSMRGRDVLSGFQRNSIKNLSPSLNILPALRNSNEETHQERERENGNRTSTDACLNAKTSRRRCSYFTISLIVRVIKSHYLGARYGIYDDK
jgi:hypothetical protein